MLVASLGPGDTAVTTDPEPESNLMGILSSRQRLWRQLISCKRTGPSARLYWKLPVVYRILKKESLRFGKV